MIFVGVDWAEDHHDLCLVDEAGHRLTQARLSTGVDGVRRFHELVAEHNQTGAAADVVVGVETDRGLLVGALVAAGYSVYAINPLAASRYRERHTVSGAKSDAGDALMLAELVRTDRHNHRQVEADTDLAEAIKVLARAHKSLIWMRQRHVNQLRNALLDFYPQALQAFGTDLTSGDALAILAAAPTPSSGRSLPRAKVAAALRRGGRERHIEARATEIHEALRSPQLEAPALATAAYGATVRALVAVIGETNRQIAHLEDVLTQSFECHPDAKILRSLPGLGAVLGARVLAEFGDSPTRFHDARARKNYAGTAPITRASGKHRSVQARYACNKRLLDTCDLWAFCTLTASPGARRYYDALRARGQGHHQALRQLANRLVAGLYT